MIGGPFLGVILHSVGGVAHGTFYAPLKKVEKWSWESGWLIQGLAAWVIVPWLVASGIAMKEWKGVSKKTMNLVYLGLVLLLLSTVITAVGNSSAPH